MSINEPKYRFSDFTIENYRKLIQLAKKNFVISNIYHRPTRLVWSGEENKFCPRLESDSPPRVGTDLAPWVESFKFHNS